jgi:hypothetical protein
MNVGDPLWNNPKTSDAASANTSAPSTQSNSTDSGLSISQNQTDALITAISTSGSHLWTFKSYWYTTVHLTVATIILPLILGEIVRCLSKFSYHYRGYWRALVSVLVFAFAILANLFIPALGYDILFGIYLGVPAIGLLIRAFMKKRHRAVWIGFAVTFFSSLFGTLLFQYLYGFYFSPGLIGLLPLVYLFYLW